MINTSTYYNVIKTIGFSINIQRLYILNLFSFYTLVNDVLMFCTSFVISKESGIGATNKLENEASEQMQTNSSVSCKEPWNWTQLTLTILMWIFAWLFCIEHQFGAVFFVVSMIFFIYYNTRTGRKEKNRLSAYSVFNPNCERIDGTFTSEQFEKELLHGANSVRS